MVQALVNLCHALVQTNYGELSAQIFSTLAEHGRLTVNQLFHHSNFPVRDLERGLSILIEQRILQRYSADDESPAFFQVDLRAAYNLARHDNLVKSVSERFGEDGGLVVGNVLRVGHARIADLQDAYEAIKNPDLTKSADDDDDLTEVVKPASAVNGHSLPSNFHAVTRKLLQAGILVKINLRSYIPAADLETELEESVLDEMGDGNKPNGPKKKAQLRSGVEELKRKWRDEEQYSDSQDIIFKPHKRAKVNGDMPNGHRVGERVADLGPEVSPDLIVAVNHAKCMLAMRSQRHEALARRYLGPVTSAVYGALLRALEPKCDALEGDESNVNVVNEDDLDERLQPSVNIRAIEALLDPNLDLASALQGFSSDGSRDADPEFAELGIKSDAVFEQDDGEKTKGYKTFKEKSARLHLIAAHLEVLAEHSKGFCELTKGGVGNNMWSVDFPEITRSVVESDVDEIILSRHGKIHLRLVRILRDAGKLEEKQIGAKALLPVKDIYTLLTQLQYDGMVECQELPKDNTRQPGRTLYLWHTDHNHVRDQILQRTYKSMARHLQRVHTERERHRAIIEKAERSDVKGREHEKLAANEKEALRRWREVEERLLGQVTRMDDVVALYRDYPARTLGPYEDEDDD